MRNQLRFLTIKFAGKIVFQKYDFQISWDLEPDIT